MFCSTHVVLSTHLHKRHKPLPNAPRFWRDGNAAMDVEAFTKYMKENEASLTTPSPMSFAAPPPATTKTPAGDDDDGGSATSDIATGANDSDEEAAVTKRTKRRVIVLEAPPTSDARVELTLEQPVQKTSPIFIA